MCVFVLAIPTTTPQVTTGRPRPKYCGTVPTVVSCRCISVGYDVVALPVGCGRRRAASVKSQAEQKTEKLFIFIMLCYLSEQCRGKVSSKVSSFCQHANKMYLLLCKQYYIA